jgi:RND family efflux transporter MFP subunit
MRIFSMRRQFGLSTLSVAVFLACAVAVVAQSGGPSAVHYAEARSHRFSQRVQLPGTVRADLVSTVATESAGLVVEFSAREGETVEAGRVLARLQRRGLELRHREAEAQLREDEARMSLAERTLERTRELLAKGAVSRQDLDDAQFDFDAWRGRTERLRAVIDQLEYALDQTEIRAPFTGVVVRERTQVGEWIEIGGAVVELLSLDDLEVLVDLPERYFGSLRVGTRARVGFESLPDLSIDGTVAAVIPRADERTRTFPVKLRIPNPGGRVGIGMLANVELNLGSATGTIVPKDSIVRENQDLFAYVLDGGDVVRRVSVRTGSAVGAWVEVSGGVQPGQKIVTRGNERLRDGQSVVAEADRFEYALQ